MLHRPSDYFGQRFLLKSTEIGGGALCFATTYIHVVSIALKLVWNLLWLNLSARFSTTHIDALEKFKKIQLKIFGTNLNI